VPVVLPGLRYLPRESHPTLDRGPLLRHRLLCTGALSVLSHGRHPLSVARHDGRWAVGGDRHDAARPAARNGPRAAQLHLSLGWLRRGMVTVMPGARVVAAGAFATAQRLRRLASDIRCLLRPGFRRGAAVPLLAGAGVAGPGPHRGANRRAAARNGSTVW